MQIPVHRKQRTMAQQVKWVLAVLLFALVIYTFGSAVLLEREGRRAVREMDQMSGLYTDELDNRFLRVSRNLFSTIMEKNQPESMFWKYVGMMLAEPFVDYPLTELRQMMLSGIWEYGTEYEFFLYLAQRDEYYQLSIGPDGSYVPSPEIKGAVLAQIRNMEDTSYSVKKKWNIITSGGENYMCKIAQNREVYLGCYVSAKSILQPFSALIAGSSGYVRLVDGDGKIVGILTSRGISDGMGEYARETSGDTRFSIEKQLSQAPFRIQMQISGERMWDVMMGSIVVLVAVAAILILSSALILLYLRRNILRPMQLFTQNLEKYDEGEYEFRLTEGNLLELEQIDDKFRHMLHQIRRLKITLYEHELEKQKVEMDYLKLQIRPHFYLNCLNFIYSMIDFGQYDHARRMSSITADYLTYIFRNTSDLVPVLAETEHCGNYLKILLLRYPESFDYYVEVHREVENAAIFPFLIQVFVENAAKHALTLEEKILISVTVFPEDREEGKYVNLYISDTGKGFPEEILSRLQDGKSISDGGDHVGITNCLKRFRYYYGKKGEIYFDNSPLGGAIVDIHIPC